MFRKASVPMFVLLGAISASLVAGCGSDGGGGSGGASGTGGARTGGAPGSGGAASGGAAGGSAGAAGGSAGSAGAAGGRGGSAGGAAGGSAGAAGGRGGSAGGSAGAAGGSAGAAAGGAGGGTTAAAVEAKCADNMYGMNNGTGVFTAVEFCTLYLDTCDTPATGYTTMATCQTSWTTAMAGAQAHCRTYHLCNAATAGPASTHCPHATGMGACMGN